MVEAGVVELEAANGHGTEQVKLKTMAAEHPAAEGEAPNGNGHHAEEDDDSEGEGEEGANGGGEAEKKKKKKKKPKKKKAAVSKVPQAPALAQSEPPRVGLTKMFPNQQFPIGECHEYLNANAFRTTSEEMRAKEKEIMSEPSTHAFNYNAIRRAAEAHRQVRQYVRANVKPGMTMTEIAHMVEDGTRALIEENGMESGIGFPTGLSLDHCAAHYTPNPGDKTVLQASNVLKVDFGIHVAGRIVDSAFTMTFEPTYNRLLEAVKDATNTGVREAGIDVRTNDIGAAIQEVMESYEVELKGKMIPVKTIRNLSGHSINPYQIHGGKNVPIVRGQRGDKMEEGDYFAIETFGSTGRGEVFDDGACSHFAKQVDARHVPLRLQSSKHLLNVINSHFGTLPFCRRYLERAGEAHHLLALNDLVSKGIVQDYPPLSDIKGCMTAQFEHTIILRPTCKEVVSRGDDY
ncbi:uncharacterized protein L969DRAFT_106016 [Mixia osmundae IAM 14324]|uniref:Methionine aminopeptidase 2 n=1 Tax=Mixia osmundae (strain CBS 9802 / IAM 14324 / JCM 22182 / KY 12970) TaxID=764103 RepID=G7DVG9_MIXOS|nr:uncharacterized protein L969DRAFT_106016 [Mixia osmundae IAM 14324]KEI36367.1 hypothetical protein L969DRAFT_106016 [Mixia osmundae IAM 14324]GAA94579.1 hypothetical protein E5Q_01231 [Mixia osmundae IAM 14324]